MTTDMQNVSTPFVGFTRQWTPVALSSELRDKPLAVTVATDVVGLRFRKRALAIIRS
jgi:hypothetical protein